MWKSRISGTSGGHSTKETTKPREKTRGKRLRTRAQTIFRTDTDSTSTTMTRCCTRKKTERTKRCTAGRARRDMVGVTAQEAAGRLSLGGAMAASLEEEGPVSEEQGRRLWACPVETRPTVSSMTRRTTSCPRLRRGVCTSTNSTTRTGGPAGLWNPTITSMMTAETARPSSQACRRATRSLPWVSASAATRSRSAHSEQGVALAADPPLLLLRLHQQQPAAPSIRACSPRRCLAEYTRLSRGNTTPRIRTIRINRQGEALCSTARQYETANASHIDIRRSPPLRHRRRLDHQAGRPAIRLATGRRRCRACSCTCA